MKYLRRIWRALLNRPEMDTEYETSQDLPPAPDQVALTLMQGFAANGHYEDFEALIGQAWAAVPHFYLWRNKYADQIAPMFFMPVGVGVPEPDFAAQLAEARLGVSSDPDADDPPNSYKSIFLA